VTDLGTLAWSQRTGGRISTDDERTLGGQLAALLSEAPRDPRCVSFDVDDLTPPDSALTREVDELWRDVAPSWLVGHGYRTWCFAAAFGLILGLDADPELLYAACVLHDLGLTPPHGPSDEQPCFAVSGARAARPLVARHRPDGADTVAEAIVMHLNLDLHDAGPVHRLLHAGTLSDVTGLRLNVVPEGVVSAVMRRYPRGGFGVEVGNALRATATRYPASRCGWLERNIALSDLTARHPSDHR
jgi:hypothetical protein